MPSRIRPGSDFCGKIQVMDQVELETLLADLPLGGIRYFSKVGSTNDLAARWARAGAQDFSLVVADEQTAGRGRLNRRWFTPPGSGLAFSLILRPEDLPAGLISAPLQSEQHSFTTRLTALGALAVCETLNQVLSPVLPAQIKWPNDVIATRRKLAGVLVELHWSGDQLQAAVLGIGVNVTPASVPPPGELYFPATCVEQVVGNPIDRWILLHDILENLWRWREQMASDKFMHAWSGRLAFRGEWVTIVLESGEEQDTPSTLEGQIAGLNPDGLLRLRLRSGEITFVNFGEIRLRPIDNPAN
jgi:BirA family biotin operon repressor/biotin-[acetyl-CoA-carboxylase] ligase